MTVATAKKSKSANLHRAKVVKDDEFYTPREAIEKELRHYRKKFRGKTVLINCDGSLESRFREHFMLAFGAYGLKKLIVTTFNMDDSPARKYEFTEEPEIVDNMVQNAEYTLLEGNGDFRSEENIELLKECDIVVGNPPFSFMYEYVAQILKHKKQFLIVGPLNAVTGKDIFPLIRDNKIWLGVSTGAVDYQRPDGSSKKLGNTCWFTNLMNKKRTEEIETIARYKGNTKSYKKYYNFDAINVDRVKDIPMDYAGMMGVPVTILDKINPKQIEIIGYGKSGLGSLIGVKHVSAKHKKEAPGLANGTLFYIDDAGKAKMPFARVIIRLRNPL